MFSVSVFIVLSFVLFSIQCGVIVHDPFYCYSEDPIRQWTALGGIHSPYEAVRGRNINADVSACNPSKFWLTSRHGARWPLNDELPDLIRVTTALHSQILSNYNQGRTTLCKSDFELIRNWKFDPNITMENAAHLTLSGWNEMKALARRYQAAFPSILPSTYSPEDYFFRATDFQRTDFSLRAFADGLFGVGGNEQVRFEDIPAQDYLMRGYLYCPYFEQLDDDRTEQNAFVDGPEYQEMLMQVSARLGFHNAQVLRNSDIGLLALQCKYEQTWNVNYTSPSPFCAAFSVANAQVLEYSQDVNWYQRIGYGRPQYRRLYESLTCLHVQNLLHFIQSNDVNDHKARIFNGSVHQFLILLHFEAFAGDEPLTRHNFVQQSQRVWRSSEMFPMAANLAIIRYDCPDGDDNELLFLFNEKPMQIPGCEVNGVCRQSVILERLNRFLDTNCMEVFCTNF